MADQSEKLISGNYTTINGRVLLSVYNEKTGRRVDGSYSGMGWFNNNEARGIALFDSYTGSNINVHIWGANGAVSRKKIKDVYRYVFDYLNCNRLTGIFPVSNKNLLQLIERFDFVYECTMHDYFGAPEAPEDGLVYYISREKAKKWIS